MFGAIIHSREYQFINSQIKILFICIISKDHGWTHIWCLKLILYYEKEMLMLLLHALFQRFQVKGRKGGERKKGGRKGKEGRKMEARKEGSKTEGRETGRKTETRKDGRKEGRWKEERAEGRWKEGREGKDRERREGGVIFPEFNYIFTENCTSVSFSMYSLSSFKLLSP